ncbi:hypothetical protein K501DRAFT_289677 [Backusella circina FSU 941]|nr:hypothetical protein K501DRAFT_289677 [Backusella circina FSU 941]
MLISTITLIFVTALSLLTTVYVATNYDIQDYYFLRDIFVTGMHNLVTIESKQTDLFEAFENFEQADFLEELALLFDEWDFGPSFEEDPEASPYDLFIGESVAVVVVEVMGVVEVVEHGDDGAKKSTLQKDKLCLQQPICHRRLMGFFF